jgi:hypothetical protein
MTSASFEISISLEQVTLYQLKWEPCCPPKTFVFSGNSLYKIKSDPSTDAIIYRYLHAYQIFYNINMLAKY